MMEEWDEIRRWRRSMRAELIANRLAVPRTRREEIRKAVADLALQNVPMLRHGVIGFYWPIKAEIDLRHLVRECMESEASAALPVAVEKSHPLEFWMWWPRAKLERGFWDIPIPAQRRIIRPSILLVPLVGFDAAGYRLGYGGGYFDRTLTTLVPKPVTIGVGYALGRLETIHPQPHDIPLDAIVSEAGFEWHRYRGQPVAVGDVPDAGPARLDQSAEART